MVLIGEKWWEVMLIGTYENKVVAGRRLVIPSKLRGDLGRKCVIAKWYEKSLLLVSAGQWEELIKKLTGSAQVITQPVRDTDRFILGSAYEVAPDSQGRVVLPLQLQKHAGIRDEVVFLGLGARVEVWDRGEWEKRERYIGEKASDMVETLALARLRGPDA